MTAHAAGKAHDDRLQADGRAAGVLEGARRHEGDGVDLTDASLDAVSGGAPQRFYPLAELFRMVTGLR